MMMQLPDTELWRYIHEDVPYFDLTTHLLAPPAGRYALTITTRSATVAACTEEAGRIGELLNCEPVTLAPSGSVLDKGGVLLRLTGSGEALHQAWRLCQILLEYACGMAGYAQAMLAEARMANPACEVFVTRKSLPFAKPFCIKAMLAGGILPHRLGLSETVLVFAQHRTLFPSEQAFQEALAELKQRCVEKKVVVEAATLAEAKTLFALGVDVVQLDKCEPWQLKELVAWKRAQYPAGAILAAGGIRQDNARAFAAAGVEGLVTSAPYQAGMANLGATLEPAANL